MKVLAGYFGALQCRFDVARQLSDVTRGVLGRFTAHGFGMGRCLGL
jgi:hypothetical protein